MSEGETSRDKAFLALLVDLDLNHFFYDPATMPTMPTMTSITTVTSTGGKAGSATDLTDGLPMCVGVAFASEHQGLVVFAESHFLISIPSWFRVQPHKRVPP